MFESLLARIKITHYVGRRRDTTVLERLPLASVAWSQQDEVVVMGNDVNELVVYVCVCVHLCKYTYFA